MQNENTYTHIFMNELLKFHFSCGKIFTQIFKNEKIGMIPHFIQGKWHPNFDMWNIEISIVHKGNPKSRNPNGIIKAYTFSCRYIGTQIFTCDI